MKETRISKEAKILLIEILRNRAITDLQKQEIINLLNLHSFTVEVIDKREQVRI